MSNLLEIVTYLISGGIVGKLIDIFLNRRRRKREGVADLMQTIDLLMKSNSQLVNDKIALEHQIAQIQAQIYHRPAPQKPLYPNSRRALRKPPRVNKNETDENEQVFIEDEPCDSLFDEPP